MSSDGGTINPAVWEVPGMRAALAAQNICAVYWLLIKTGVSQQEIAQLTGQSQSEISEILKGRPVTREAVLRRIAEGLGVRRAWMNLEGS